MKKLNQMLALTGVALALSLSGGQVSAQQPPGGGNFDPQQMMQQIQQRMMESYREQLGVTDNDEWKIIEERLSKVMQARMETLSGGTGLMGFGGRGGFGNRSGAGSPGGGRGFQALLGQPSPEAEALQKAIEAKASPDEIKAKLAKYRAVREQKQANLAKAQDELRKVLSTLQEATAVLMGLLD